MPIAHNLGFPPIGAGRELKRATEGYWGGKVSREQLLRTGAELRAAHWRLQRDAGLDLVPVNDFSFYDRVLDTCALVGAVPDRKSTRLNSSHSQISYAVFCLKKKKKNMYSTTSAATVVTLNKGDITCINQCMLSARFDTSKCLRRASLMSHYGALPLSSHSTS